MVDKKKNVVKTRAYFFPEIWKSVIAENMQEATKKAKNLYLKKEENVWKSKKDTILKK